MIDTLIVLIGGTITLATPIILGSMGGVFTENSGIMNIGLEGMMLFGAFTAVLGVSFTGSVFIGLVTGMLGGGILGLLHAYVTVSKRGNQVVSGAAINILAAGLPSLLIIRIWKAAGRTPRVERLNALNIPVIEDIPILGRILAQFNILVYVMFITVFLTYIVLYKTRFGLRIRAIGQHPKSADTVGVNVAFVRYVCVIISGVLAGLGGAYLSVGEMGMFTTNISSGRGFIALAAMIFGKWRPVQAMFAGFIFGGAQALQMAGQVAGWPLPSELFNAIPYLLTVLVMAGFVRNVVAPAAIGKPYPE